MAKVGDIIKVKKVTTGHNYQLGTKYRLTISYGANGWMADSLATPPVRGNTYIRESDFDVVYDKKSITEEIVKMELKLNSIKRKKDYLKQNKLKEMDNKTFGVLEIIEEASRTDKPEKDKIKAVEYLLDEIDKW